MTKLLDRLAVRTNIGWARPDVVDHRQEAARCRAVAGECLHRPTGESLRELAAEYDAAADRVEAESRLRHGGGD